MPKQSNKNKIKKRSKKLKNEWSFKNQIEIDGYNSKQMLENNDVIC